MPQVLKEEIREKIRESALNEFYERGFKSATMKDIATAAGIPTGLIYSYFTSKADLFEKVVQPVISLMNDIAIDNMTDNPAENLYKRELPAMLRCIEYHNREMVVLIDKSDGSRFNGIKDEFINDVAQHLKKTPVLKRTDFDDIFYHIMATNFMEGMFEIARHYRGRQWAENMMGLLINQHLYGTSSLAEYENN